MSARLLTTFAALLLASGAAAANDERNEDPADDRDDAWGDDWEEGEAGGLVWTGFVEGAAGWRWSGGENRDAMTLGELRARAETRWDAGPFRLDFKGDLAWDAVADELDAKARELAVSFRPAAPLDVKLGRQVLTWGTGDLLFLNDLFPKDFISFFAGRDEEYLKAPSDTLRATVFTPAVNVDVAWTPDFTPDEYLYGEPFPLFERRAPEPGGGELALRAFRTVGSTEYAAYGYRGRWKQPVGLRVDGTPWFPRLDVWGASVRTGLQRGIFNAEFAWYDSRQDDDGSDPAVPNSQLRFLVGYEQELVRNLTGATQLYTEHVRDHGALIANSPAPEREPDAWRTVATLRLTHRALRDRLVSSLFAFVSPTDEDFYLRPSVTWRRDDHWSFSSGLNLLGGSSDHTFFGQLEDDSNAWLRARFNY